jgi:hypothetical protein
MVETTGKTEPANLPAKHNADAFIFQEDAEPALELENWMTNLNYFNETTMQFDEAIEQPLELQNWMLDESHFNFNIEQTMELEDWMTSEKFWKS